MTISEQAFTGTEQAGRGDAPHGPVQLLHAIREYLGLACRELLLLRKMFRDQSRPVDEEVSSLPSPLSVHADFDTVDEMITSFMVATPTGATAVTLTLGQRVIPLPAGFFQANGINMLLSKTDQRTLTWAGGGTGFMELMGYAAGDAG
jgi:hypothetical protein